MAQRCIHTTSRAEDSIEEELNYDEAFESYDSFVTDGSGGRWGCFMNGSR